MSSIGEIGGIDRRFPWSFIGCVIGLFFGAFGIYAIFFYEKRPDLQFEIISNVPVFAVKEDVNALQVVFEGKNLRESRQTLSLLTLRLVNRGNLELTTAAFDPNDPLSILIKNGRLIRSNPLQVSDDYFITKVFNRITSAPDTLTFPTFIMEPGEFLNMKLLILHQEDTVPSLETKGKIAKLGTVPIVESGKESWMEERRPSTFGGSFKVQVIRVFTYGFGMILFVGSVIGVFFLHDILINILRNRAIRKRIRLSSEELLRGYPRKIRTKLTYVRDAIIRNPSLMRHFPHREEDIFLGKAECERETREFLCRLWHRTGRSNRELHSLMNDNDFLKILNQFLMRLNSRTFVS